MMIYILVELPSLVVLMESWPSASLWQYRGNQTLRTDPPLRPLSGGPLQGGKFDVHLCSLRVQVVLSLEHMVLCAHRLQKLRYKCECCWRLWSPKTLVKSVLERVKRIF